MAQTRGSLVDTAPVVSIAVTAGPASARLTAVVDTGFDGFAAIPTAIIELLRLLPSDVADVEYADGSVGTLALAPARLVLGDEVREGLVHVTSGEALLGIDFLRAFRKTFVLYEADHGLRCPTVCFAFVRDRRVLLTTFAVGNHVRTSSCSATSVTPVGKRLRNAPRFPVAKSK